MKKLLFLFSAIIIMLIIGGCEKTPENKNVSSSVQSEINEVDMNQDYSNNDLNEYGNTAGNINNSGIATIQGDWIYYSNMSDNFYLYKIRMDGSEKTKLNDDPSSYINVVEDWIYYIDYNANGFYRIRTDGSERQILG